METLWQDARDAIRMLRTAPGFATVTILTLALGIGANTAIFSVVNSLLLRTLPVAEPQRLATVTSGTEATTGAAYPWTYAIWEQIRQSALPSDGPAGESARDRSGEKAGRVSGEPSVEASSAASGRLPSGVFDDACAWSTTRFNLAQGGEIQPVDGLLASGDFFRTLGVSALLGRTFTAADDERGGGADGAVAVISYGLWQRRFGGAASVIGAPLVVDGVPYTIVGVTPPEFFGPEVGRAFDVALPLATEPLIRGKDSALDVRHAWWLTIMVRLQPGQSLEAGTAALHAMQPQIRDAARPHAGPPRVREQFLNDPFTLAPAAGGTSPLRQRYQRPLLTILVVVGLVLLIACANVANLLLARAAGRRHEVSVRFALGASRWRLARQLLAESVLLASLGAIVGLIVAAWGSRALVAQLSTPVSRVMLDLSFDWRIVAFTAVVTLVTVLICGTAPALRATRVAPIDALKAQGRSTSSHSASSYSTSSHSVSGHTAFGGDVSSRSVWGRRVASRLSGWGRTSVSSGLVVGQIALSLVLVVAAGLFIRTFAGLASVPLGFDRDRVLVVNVDATRARINPADRIGFYHRLAEAVAAVPGVVHAGASIITPVSGSMQNYPVNVPGAPPMADRERFVRGNAITPGWLATYGTALLAGRDVDARDTKTAPPVALVNEAFVRRFYPGRTAVGQTLTPLSPPGSKDTPTPLTIVGIVRDAVYRSLRDAPQPTVYQPLAQRDSARPGATISLSVRASNGSPVLLARSVAAALTAVDRDLAFSFRPLADQVQASFGQERLVALLSGLFGVLALLLAGLGLYGVTAYAATQRRAEIGIRMALGAQRGEVIRLVLHRSLVVTAIGLACGLAGAAAVTRYLQGMLFGLTPLDPITFVVVSLLFAVVATLAALIPARRATTVDPLIALRAE